MRKNATVGLFTTRLANVAKNYQLVGSFFHTVKRILNDFARDSGVNLQPSWLSFNPEFFYYVT